ncbi:MAG: hypothetical protein WB810_02665 [Candidatus Cybelea sp.]
MDRPIGVALDAAGNIYVASNGNNSVNVYAAGSSGHVAPTIPVT